MKSQLVLIGMYLTAIVAANLSVAFFGLQFAILNQFLFIGLDLTARDSLHDLWGRNRLALKMGALIAAGSVLSAALSIQALPIAAASFLAFVATGIADTLVYAVLTQRGAFIRMNGSNIVSGAVDTITFSYFAFGLPFNWPILAGVYIAKLTGGAFWAFIITRFKTSRNRAA